MIYAGSGHRPQFLPCKFNENNHWLRNVLTDLECWIEYNYFNIEHIITGGAIGWDTWLAEASIRYSLPYVVYVPFKEQDKLWPHAQKERYTIIIQHAADVVFIKDKYSKTAFLDRDQCMVDDADKILTLWNPAQKHGGTYHTISYAESQGKEIINFWRD